MNYNNKKFRPLQNTKNGETSSETIFHYKLERNILQSTYSGGKIKTGHLIALVDENGNLDIRYHQINTKGELMTGICHSTPEILPNGKIPTRIMAMDLRRQIKRNFSFGGGLVFLSLHLDLQ